MTTLDASDIQIDAEQGLQKLITGNQRLYSIMTLNSSSHQAWRVYN
jgi:hypothetical protein